MTELTVQIISWNTRDRTLRCLRSIQAHAPDLSQLQVIVIDNASSDGTVDGVRACFPWVELICNDRNLGFGRANNLGLARATGDVVLFLNSDAEITPGFVAALLGEFHEHPDTDALGCRVIDPNGVVQHTIRRFPTLSAYLGSDTVLGTWGLFIRSRHRYRQRDFDFEQRSVVDQPMGAVLAVRRVMLDGLGGFDEQFFMYFEDVDLCKRIHDAGGRLLYSPLPTAIHVGGVSARRDKARMLLVFRQSMFRYFRKHEPRWKVGVFSALFKPLFILRVASDWLVSLVKSVTARDPERAAKYRRRVRTRAEFLSRYLGRFLVS